MTTTQTAISQDELTEAEWDERIRVYEWNKKVLRPGPEDRRAFLRGFADGLSGDAAPARLRGRSEKRIYAIGRETAQAI